MDSFVILDYIRSSVEILMNLKMEEHEHFLQMAKERQREQKREENAEIESQCSET